jgi:hypothetical protein
VKFNLYDYCCTLYLVFQVKIVYYRDIIGNKMSTNEILILKIYCLFIIIILLLLLLLVVLLLVVLLLL